MFIDFLVGGGHSFAGASWFLFALFWIRLLAFFAVNYHIEILITIISLCIAYLFRFPCYYDLTAAAAAFPLFIVGVYMKRYKLIERIHRNKIFISISSFLLLCVFCFSMGCVSIYSLNFGKYPFVYYFYILLGSVFFISFCMCIANKSSNVIVNISRGTILIMCLHGVFALYINILISRIFPIHPDTLVYSLVSSVCTIYILYKPMVLMMKKYPILTGGR